MTPALIVVALAAASAASTAACASYPKRLAYFSVESRALGEAMRYGVYAPIDQAPDERLPLVVFLHGGGDGEECFDRWEIGARLDRAIASGNVPRAIVAVPDGDLGFWANWADGSYFYEDWVVHEVMPAVQRDYRTLPCPEGCSVMGVSMGASGTMRFVFHEPERFQAAAVISGPIMDTDAMLSFKDNLLVQLLIPADRIWGSPPREVVEREDPFLRWRRAEDLPVRLFLAHAAEDRSMIVSGTARLHEHLGRRAIPHRFEVFRGGHDWRSWGPVIERAITFLARPRADGAAPGPG
jgi:enterochelin esterase-like enzyme